MCGVVPSVSRSALVDSVLLQESGCNVLTFPVLPIGRWNTGLKQIMLKSLGVYRVRQPLVNVRIGRTWCSVVARLVLLVMQPPRLQSIVKHNSGEVLRLIIALVLFIVHVSTVVLVVSFSAVLSISPFGCRLNVASKRLTVLCPSRRRCSIVTLGRQVKSFVVSRTCGLLPLFMISVARLHRVTSLLMFTPRGCLIQSVFSRLV